MGNFKKMKTLQQVEQDEHDAQVKAEDEEMKKETRDEIEILGIPEVIGEDIDEVCDVFVSDEKWLQCGAVITQSTLTQILTRATPAGLREPYMGCPLWIWPLMHILT